MANRDCWEYMFIPERERSQLHDLGQSGWELVAIGGAAIEPVIYLKRPYADLRERVALDQRNAYFAAGGLEQDGRAAE